MKKFFMVFVAVSMFGLAGCAATDNTAGGDKSSKSGKKADIECASTGSRLKKRC